MEASFGEKRIREFLKEVSSKGDLLGLTSIKRLLEELGNPQAGLKVISVVGTNGKGSVCSYLASVLGKAGYRVGVFTSPEVFSYEERFVCTGQMITEEEFTAAVEKILPAYRSIEAEGGPRATIFEVETVAAILYFVEKGCDLCLFEAGMGGDLDATNVFGADEQVLAVFASIGMDHMAFLGDTIDKIARHKAGIMQDGGRAVSTWQEEAVEKVLCEEAAKRGVELYFADRKKLRIADKKAEKRSQDLSDMAEWGPVFATGRQFSYKSFQDLFISMVGDFQYQNVAAALETVEVLRNMGYDIPEEAVEEGMRQAFRPGRMEVISKEPLIILDGAHNLPAMRCIAEELTAYKKRGMKICLVIGVLSDKAYESELELLLPLVACIVTVTSTSERALMARDLTATCRKVAASLRKSDAMSDLSEDAKGKGSVSPMLYSAQSFSDAADHARSSGCDLIFCTGSLSLLKDMREAFL